MPLLQRDCPPAMRIVGLLKQRDESVGALFGARNGPFGDQGIGAVRLFLSLRLELVLDVSGLACTRQGHHLPGDIPEFSLKPALHDKEDQHHSGP